MKRYRMALVLALLMLIPLVLCGCGRPTWERGISARSYPLGASFSIPIQARVYRYAYLNENGYQITEKYGDTDEVLRAARKAELTVTSYGGQYGTEYLFSKDGNYWLLGGRSRKACGSFPAWTGRSAGMGSTSTMSCFRCP